MKKRFFLAAMTLLVSMGAFAQGNGIAGISEATNMVTSYFDPGTKLIYAIGAVIGLIGGVKVYSKFSSGDPDTSKTAASWFGACIFLICSLIHISEPTRLRRISYAVFCLKKKKKKKSIKRTQA